MLNNHAKKMKPASRLLIALSAALLVVACGGGSGTPTMETTTAGATPSPTPTPSSTPTPSASPTSAGTPTPTPTPTPTSTFSLVPKAGGGNYALSECVFDNTSGLMWQGRTNSGLRSSTNLYTNYDSTTVLQIENQVGVIGQSVPTQAQVDAYNNTVGFKNDVNATALCGFSDWRIPSKEELKTLDATMYPNLATWFPTTTQSLSFWSSTTGAANAGGTLSAFRVDLSGYGVANSVLRQSRLPVMLVR